MIDNIQTRTDLWKLHPQGEYFLGRGGDRIEPPAMVSIAVTNKCNLRCAICGSQTTLDRTRTTRSHIPLSVFNAIAETVFPVVAEVELNSQGDPLLHPEIDLLLETVARHRCELHLQTNGTLFTDALIDRLVSMHGNVQLSIDAVGSLFDVVRQNGVWTKAEPMMRRLFAHRDPGRLALRLYPTVTRRTVGNMLDVARWAAEMDLDNVVFHLYDPLPIGIEEVPSKEELDRSTDDLMDWIERENAPVGICIGSNVLREPVNRRVTFADPVKSRFVNRAPSYPIDAGHPWAPTRSLCMSPFRFLDVGMAGQIAACCRSQGAPLGVATSVEEFAGAWLGPNYRMLRESLSRGDQGPLPLPDCLACIRHAAPKAGETAWAVTYSNGKGNHPRAFTHASERVPLSLIFRKDGAGVCFTGRIPFGLDPEAYLLFEDDQPLAHPGASVADIAALGEGRYRIDDNIVYFSASDRTVPVRNERRYELRRKPMA
ncbi:radical SAM protein [Azospirillum endophyticum]